MSPLCMLTGASGNLGRSIRQLWPIYFPDQQLVLIDRNSATLEDRQSTADLLARIRPDIILHCAAISNPDRCDEQPETASRLHHEVTAQFAAHARRCSGWVLHCSTDFVFCGDVPGRRHEQDAAEPLNHYGCTKLAGEAAVLAEGSGLVARLALMHSPPPGGREGGWHRVQADLAAGRPVQGVVDEWRTPIAYADAAAILLTLARQRRTGLVHVGGPDVLSPHDLISRLAARMGSPSCIIPVSRDQFRSGHRRPRNVALATRRLADWLASGQLAAAS